MAEMKHEEGVVQVKQVEGFRGRYTVSFVWWWGGSLCEATINSLVLPEMGGGLQHLGPATVIGRDEEESWAEP